MRIRSSKVRWYFLLPVRGTAGVVACPGRSRFSFHARAITGTDALYLSVVKWRIRQSVSQDFVCFFVGEASPACQLFKLSGFAHERESMEIVLSVLHLHLVEVYASGINADGCTRLHAVGSNAMTRDGFCQVIGGRFCTSSSGQHFTAYVHQSVQECTGSKDDTFRLECDAPAGRYACHFPVLY